MSAGIHACEACRKIRIYVGAKACTTHVHTVLQCAIFECVCRIPDPLLLQQSSNELISLWMYLKQVTAVWIINSRLYAHDHVIYVLVAVIVTAVIVVQAGLVLVVNAVVV